MPLVVPGMLPMPFGAELLPLLLLLLLLLGLVGA
jgi:hypothetical protein